ncbi:MAG TPA: 2'-5' RNA ligase family protein [Candidatus Saccharibacteria bacterium]|nr:2'-5' RNA ligase family protein [Candidatus Saccharibacteria bacterium]HRQ07207.1 2'-5' RNA ligase family protein [Candidatus Saccharibacteria bacterium]
MKLSVVSYLDSASLLKVREVQGALSKITGSKASLTSWDPHITIGDGIVVNDESLQEFQSEIQTIASPTLSFQLKLGGIGTMDNFKGGSGEKVSPFVLYLDVDVTDQLLQLVEKVSQISSGFEKWYFMPKPYEPHCTLAFRDLTEDGFKLGCEYLKKQDINLISTIDHIALVEKLENLDKELLRVNLEK